MDSGQQVNGAVIRGAIVAALGSFLFGFDTAVISGTTTDLREVFSLSSGELGFTVAIALIGTVIGSLMVGTPVDRYGRKPVMLFLALLYFLSALGCALAWNWHSLLFFRFIGGLGVGGASVVSPMYIAEIAPPRQRGRLVATSQMNIVLGILVAYFSNYLMTSFATGDQLWRWMLGIEAIPAVLFIIMLFTIDESPRFLVKSNREEEATKVLGRLGARNPEVLLNEIKVSLAGEQNDADERFFQRKYLTPILLAIMVATFNQFAGINALIYYTADIFKMAGAEQTSALFQSVLIGVTNLVLTMIAMIVIDHFGRRNLLLVGSAGLTVCLLMVAYGFTYADGGAIVVTGLIGYIAFFAFSQGAVIWVYLSEIFPNKVRARGQALGSFTHWFWCAAVSWSFPVIADFSKAGPFLFFAFMMVLQFFMVWKFLPETKGVSLEEIQKKLGIS